MGGLDWPAGQVFPRFQPIQRLWVVNATGASTETLTALASAEGLVNRPRPRLYVVQQSDDTFWLNHALPGVTHESLPNPGCSSKASSTPTTLLSLTPLMSYAPICDVLRKFPGVVKGLIIYADPSTSPVTAEVNVATTMAGVDDAMIVTPAMASVFEAAPFDLKVIANLTTMGWTSNDQAYEWEYEDLWPKTQHRLIFDDEPTNPKLREYVVATKGYVVWLDPTVSQDASLLTEILKNAMPFAPILGWWTNEEAGVSLGSTYGHATIASDYIDNLSVFSSFPPAAGLKQTAPAGGEPKAPPQSGIYYSVEFSDGDNIQYMQHQLLVLWKDPARADTPAAFTIQPWAADLIPTIVEYYYRTAGPGDYFVTGPSGPGYFYPRDWPSNTLQAWLQKGVPLLRDLDIHMVEVWNYSLLNLQTYLQVYHPSALLLGGGSPSAQIYNAGTAVETVNLGSAETVAQAESFMEGLQSQATSGPVFVNLYVIAWDFTPTMVTQLESALGSQYHLVRLDQLMTMWSEAHPARSSSAG